MLRSGTKIDYSSLGIISGAGAELKPVQSGRIFTCKVHNGDTRCATCHVPRGLGEINRKTDNLLTVCPMTKSEHNINVIEHLSRTVQDSFQIAGEASCLPLWYTFLALSSTFQCLMKRMWGDQQAQLLLLYSSWWSNGYSKGLPFQKVTVLFEIFMATGSRLQISDVSET